MRDHIRTGASDNLMHPVSVADICFMKRETRVIPERSNVGALAGRVVSRRGRVYVFALLMNGGELTAARNTQDRIVALLASGAADAT